MMKNDQIILFYNSSYFFNFNSNILLHLEAFPRTITLLHIKKKKLLTSIALELVTTETGLKKNKKQAKHLSVLFVVACKRS